MEFKELLPQDNSLKPFKDVQFMTAKEKDLVLVAWKRFLASGLAKANFTDRLYKHLINHCSFIAHYNINGFYDEYFRDGDDKVHFLSQFDIRKAGPDGIPQSIEYGGTYWADRDYEDLNRAMIQAATPYIPKLVAEAEANQMHKDLAIADTLYAKHGRKGGEK